MKRYWPVVAVVTLLLLWWGFSRRDSLVTLHFSTARRETIVSTVSTNGKVEPVAWAAARAETPGVVRRVSVQRGQHVVGGQELMVLDTTSARTDLAAALAKEHEAGAEVSVLTQGGKAQTVADLNDSIASAQAAVQVAQRNYDSLQRLADKQAATTLQVQDAKDALDRARLHLHALTDQKQTLVTASDLSVAEAKLSDARSAVALARHKLQLAIVSAPMPGILYQFDIKVGSYLQPGDLVGLVGDLDRVKVVVYVDEPDLGRVTLNMPVNITWDARPGRKWSGRVDKLPSEVVALGTRTVGEVSTIVDNPSHDLLPGVSVNVTIVSKVVNDGVSIPRAALRSRSGVPGVYKLTGETIAWVPVTAGISDVNNVQILSGVEAGDKVADRVVDPSDAEMRPGIRVNVQSD